MHKGVLYLFSTVHISQLILFTVHPGRVSKKERIHLLYMGKGKGWNETATTQLTLKWNSSLLTDNRNANISISLMGYKEDNNEVSHGAFFQCTIL